MGPLGLESNCHSVPRLVEGLKARHPAPPRPPFVLLLTEPPGERFERLTDHHHHYHHHHQGKVVKKVSCGLLHMAAVTGAVTATILIASI